MSKYYIVTVQIMDGKDIKYHKFENNLPISKDQIYYTGPTRSIAGDHDEPGRLFIDMAVDNAEFNAQVDEMDALIRVRNAAVAIRDASAGKGLVSASDWLVLDAALRKGGW